MPYVFGTVQHNEKTFGHGEEISASDVEGQENLDALIESGSVVETDPKPGELELLPGQTINSLQVDPRPGPGGVQMDTALPEPRNVPKDIRTNMIGAPGSETKSVGAPDLSKSVEAQQLEIPDSEKTLEKPLGGAPAKAAAESTKKGTAPTGVATSKDEGDTGKSGK